MNHIKSVFLSSVLIVAGFGFSLAQATYPFPELGKLKTLAAQEIETSRWSIGGETLDRGYADYHSYKEYLGSLGAKRIRLQGGWAKCEQEKGVYDFEWLDKIIDDALSRGVKPWVQPSYGNPIYEGGGDAALAGGIPTSDEALAAWDNWVEALINRYKDKVIEWEIWNEPDISKKFSAADFAAFHVRTSDIIKRIQPEARIIALGLAGLSRTEYVKSILDILKAEGKLHHFNVLTFHGYHAVPETSYAAVAKLRELLDEYNSEIELWQGENGAPSTPIGQSVGALRQFDWSETSQAKWVLRRMLGDMGNGVDVTSIFQISDMHYGKGDHLEGLNSKGLLKTNPDGSIVRPKESYYAYQHTATLFSGIVEKKGTAEEATESVMVYGYSRKGEKGNALTLWRADAKPEDSMETFIHTFTVQKMQFNNPVFVNLLDGKVYELPKENYSKKGKSFTFANIPVGDWPVVIADRSWVDL
jgi:polysaccharide biosynthesis protein PslG